MLKNISKLNFAQRALVTRCYSSNSTVELLNIKINETKGTAIVEMNGPPVNSLNTPMIKSLTKALTDLENNKCRGLILTSALKSTFSAGLDIREMYKPDLDKLNDFWNSLQDLWIKLYGTSLATVAAVNGHSPAGGCLLSMCCDYRIMVGPNYRIGLNETKLGIVAPFWFKDTMVNTVGVRQTELALQLGTLFSAEEALKVGLVDQVVESKEAALLAAEKVLDEFLVIPGKARHLSKLIVRQDAIAKLTKLKEADTKQFVDFCTSAKVQKSLEIYLSNLSKKKN